MMAPETASPARPIDLRRPSCVCYRRPMSSTASPIPLNRDAATGLPIAPTSAEWGALTPEEQERVTLALMAALGDWELTLPPEGTPHGDAQRDAMDRFRRHFDWTRRGVFLAANLMVQYPGERGFAPDLLAVLDVPLHHRMSWVVDVEGKGPDFVLEVLFSGNRKKDLQTNVSWFARLGIPEYFVFDGGRRRIYGWRRASDTSHKYLPIVPQGGRYHSSVLGLELAVVGGELKLFRDGAPILGSSEENALLTRIVDETQAALAVEAERAQQEAERAQQESERAQQESERAQQESERAAGALAALRASLRSVVSSRGWTLDPAVETRVERCNDPQQLAAWIATAARAESPADLDMGAD